MRWFFKALLYELVWLLVVSIMASGLWWSVFEFASLAHGQGGSFIQAKYGTPPAGMGVIAPDFWDPELEDLVLVDVEVNQPLGGRKELRLTFEGGGVCVVAADEVDWKRLYRMTERYCDCQGRHRR